ncbi:MAG: hypothetical protein QXD66_05775 [Candidatus Nezhaarchaeales archaeon]
MPALLSAVLTPPSSPITMDRIIDKTTTEIPISIPSSKRIEPLVLLRLYLNIPSSYLLGETRDS